MAQPHIYLSSSDYYLCRATNKRIEKIVSESTFSTWYKMEYSGLSSEQACPPQLATAFHASFQVTFNHTSREEMLPLEWAKQLLKTK